MSSASDYDFSSTHQRLLFSLIRKKIITTTIIIYSKKRKERRGVEKGGISEREDNQYLMIELSGACIP